MTNQRNIDNIVKNTITASAKNMDSARAFLVIAGTPVALESLQFILERDPGTFSFSMAYAFATFTLMLIRYRTASKAAKIRGMIGAAGTPVFVAIKRAGDNRLKVSAIQSVIGLMSLIAVCFFRPSHVTSFTTPWALITGPAIAAAWLLRAKAGWLNVATYLSVNLDEENKIQSAR